MPTSPRPIRRPAPPTPSPLPSKSQLSMPLLAITLLLAALACRPSTSDSDPSVDAWTAELPGVEAPAAGTAVWAAVPAENGTVRVGSFTVSAGAATADGGSPRDGVTLVDDLGRRFDGVPAALLRPRAQAAPAPGDVVLAQLAGGALVLARSAGDSSVRLVKNGRVVEAVALAQEALAAEAQTFRPVLYRDEVGWQRGLALAAEEAPSGHVWLQTPDGRVEKRAGAEVHAFEPAAGVEVDATVLAGSWAAGFEEATVLEIVDPGLAFLVETIPPGGQAERRIVAFGDLILPPPPWAETK